MAARCSARRRLSHALASGRHYGARHAAGIRCARSSRSTCRRTRRSPCRSCTLQRSHGDLDLASAPAGARSTRCFSGEKTVSTGKCPAKLKNLETGEYDRALRPRGLCRGAQSRGAAPGSGRCFGGVRLRQSRDRQRAAGRGDPGGSASRRAWLRWQLDAGPRSARDHRALCAVAGAAEEDRRAPPRARRWRFGFDARQREDHEFARRRDGARGRAASWAGRRCSSSRWSPDRFRTSCSCRGTSRRRSPAKCCPASSSFSAGG